jgi:hypothetical protein
LNRLRTAVNVTDWSHGEGEEEEDEEEEEDVEV